MFFRETWKLAVPVLISFFLFLSSTSLLAQPTDYLCITAHFTTEKWLQQYKREIDSTGVLIQDKQYHALSIGFWGIMNYHDFKRSGNKNAERIHFLEKPMESRATSCVEAASSSAMRAWTRPRKNA